MTQQTNVATGALRIPSVGRIVQMTREWVGSLLGGGAPDISPPPEPDAMALVVAGKPDAPKLPPAAREEPIILNSPEASLIGECSQIGIATAQSTAGVKREAVIATLTAMAPSIVQKYECEESSAEQRRRNLERIVQLDGNVEETESDCIVAAGVGRKRRAWLDANPLKPWPSPTTVFVASVIVLIMLSVAPALHDAFTGLDDSLLQWALAFAIGFAVGQFVVTALLPEGEPPLNGPVTAVASGRYDLANGLAGSFFLMRLAFTHSLQGLLMAVGGVILEIVVIRVVRAKAADLLSERESWAASLKERRDIEAETLAAERSASDFAQRAAEYKHERSEILAWIENERRSSNRKELEALAVSALVGAYSHELLKLEGRQRRSYKEAV
jgi:hypothetical protein